ncbi:MAG: asparagine synthetase B [Planctomycetes bacterium]|nr:asparagine synthetase B [Planctomycetota bacterium]
MSGKPDGLADIDGPFLLAKADPSTSKAALARDKFGIRQLFCRLEPTRLWFADDIKFILAVAPSPGLRTLALLEWMHYGVPLEPDTFFDGIFLVRAGHRLTYDWSLGEVKQECYFEPGQYLSPSMARELASRSTRTLEGRLDDCLNSAVALATSAESNVSILVSGGVDSSLLAAMASRNTDVTAVTVDVQGPGAESELEYAKAVVAHLKVEHSICRFGPSEFRETICDTVYALGTPIIVENAVALHYAAKAGYIPPNQLILDGEGGDALFCGSPNLFRYSLFTLVLSSLTGISTVRVRKALERFRRALQRLGLSTRATTDGWGLDVLLGARRLTMQARLNELLGSFAHIPDLARREIAALSLVEFYEYLVPLMLRIERMAYEADSYAVLPFLDKAVFQLSINLPIDAKIRWSWTHRKPVTKWLLKRLASRYIPRAIVYRPKGGFHMPGGNWIGDLPRAWLRDSWVCDVFGVSNAAVGEWIAQNAHSRSRMFLTTLEIWGRLFARQTPLDSVRAEWLEG